MAIDIELAKRAILDYYGSDSTIWSKIDLGTASYEEISYAMSQIPRMQAVRSSAGSILGYEYDTPFTKPVTYADDIISNVNSNSQSGSYGNTSFSGNVPVNIKYDPDRGQYYTTGGALTGALQTLSVVADKVNLAVTGVNIGAKLGMKIDQALYNANPDWWDKVLPTINPETWPSIAQSEGGQWFIRTLFGIPDSGNATSYIDAQILAQFFQAFRDTGALNTTYEYPDITSGNVTITSVISGSDFLDTVLNTGNVHITMSESVKSTIKNWLNQYPNRPVIIDKYDSIPGSFSGSSPLSFYIPTALNIGSNITIGTSYQSNVLYTTGNKSSGSQTLTITNSRSSTSRVSGIVGITGVGTTDLWISNINVTKVPVIDGIQPMPNAPIGTPSPTVITGTTNEQVLQQLKDNYPELFDGSVITSTMQDDGTITETEYIPVPWGDGLTQTTEQPTTTTQTQDNTEISDSTLSDILLNPTTENPDPPDTGDGSSDASIVPTGSASSLWAIYNPSQSQLNAFGAWLWSSDFVEQLKKLFNDPMQAIIGVHKVFANPINGDSSTIKCGYLDSGVSSATVANQYTTVDCGSVALSEYFGNVFDYAPYTQVSLYLPFIGIVPLNVDNVMRSTISVSYVVDVITGACVANVTVKRDGNSSILYTYGGSAIVTYPISSGSYASAVTGALSIIGGVAASLLSGGSAIPAMIGAASGMSHLHTSVQHSGQFSGSAGAMSGKKPYLIVERPQTRIADSVDTYIGSPANFTTQVSDCSGFVKFIETHFWSPSATAQERDEIEQLLKTGIIVSV